MSGVPGSDSRSLGDGNDGRLVAVMELKPLHPLVLTDLVGGLAGFSLVWMFELKVLMTRSGSGLRASPLVVHRPVLLITRLSQELAKVFFSVIFFSFQVASKKSR